MPHVDDYVLSTTEAAAKVHVHPDTLIRWVKAGKVGAWRTPGGYLRFRDSDLESLIASGRVEADL